MHQIKIVCLSVAWSTTTYFMLHGRPRDPSRPLLWAIELTESYFVHTSYKDKIITTCVGEILSVSKTVRHEKGIKGCISGKKSILKEEKANSKAKVAMKVLVFF